MFRAVLLVGLIIGLAGCGVIPQPVGGPCQYTTRIAEATVTAINQDVIEVQVMNVPGDGYYRVPKRNRVFRLGETVTVEVREISSGACNPVSVSWPANYTN